jgi:hypothetical protein
MLSIKGGMSTDNATQDHQLALGENQIPACHFARRMNGLAI